jgi:hypothetical protein
MLSAMILLVPASSCVSVQSDAICDSTRQDRLDHASALVQDGGPLSLGTGVRLIYKIDGYCN